MRTRVKRGMIEGFYLLNLLCETKPRCGFGLDCEGWVAFKGKTRSEAVRAARNAGWGVTNPCKRYPKGKVRCPECRKNQS